MTRFTSLVHRLDPRHQSAGSDHLDDSRASGSPAISADGDPRQRLPDDIGRLEKRAKSQGRFGQINDPFQDPYLTLLVTELEAAVEITWRTDRHRHDAQSAYRQAQVSLQEATMALTRAQETLSDAQQQAPEHQSTTMLDRMARSQASNRYYAARVACDQATVRVDNADVQLSDVTNRAIERMRQIGRSYLRSMQAYHTAYNTAAVRHGQVRLDPLPDDLLRQVITRATEVVNLGPDPHQSDA